MNMHVTKIKTNIKHLFLIHMVVCIYDKSKIVNMSQMNPKEGFHSTAYYVKLIYIAGPFSETFFVFFTLIEHVL